MNIKDVISAQYYASLEMLKQAIVKCPDALWDEPADKNRYWHIAYHALFYTHLYLQPTESDFVPWEEHKEDYHAMRPEIGEPYSKAQVLEYLEMCRHQVQKNIEIVDLHAESGFDWIPFEKLELQFYNIRHLQQHTGELCERLGSRVNIDVDWVGTKAST